jgi:hypothetical protein
VSAITLVFLVDSDQALPGLQVRFPRRIHKEVNMIRRSLTLVIAVGLAMLGSSIAWSEDSDQAALIKALGGAKLTLLQGIAQVAKGTEVPIEAKYEMAHGKLMLSIYTSAKGFDCRPKAHRSVGAISRAAVDEQSEHSRDHPEGFGARHSPGC